MTRKGFILTADSLLAMGSTAVLMALLYSLLNAPAFIPIDDNFAQDVASVYAHASLSKQDLAYMFESAGKCGGVYETLADGAEGTILEQCACQDGSSKRVYYNALPARSSSSSIIKVEACPVGALKK